MYWNRKYEKEEEKEDDLKLLGGELGQEETKALLQGDTVAGVLVIGGEAGRVGRLGDLAGRGDLLLTGNDMINWVHNGQCSVTANWRMSLI